MKFVKGVSIEVIQTLTAAISRTLERPDVQVKLLQMGVDSEVKTGAELKAFVASEKDMWGRLISAACIKPA